MMDRNLGGVYEIPNALMQTHKPTLMVRQNQSLEKEVKNGYCKRSSGKERSLHETPGKRSP
jgi:hypothetical protein